MLGKEGNKMQALSWRYLRKLASFGLKMKNAAEPGRVLIYEEEEPK
jgi:hypothetical protein